MGGIKTGCRYRSIAVVLLTFLILGGCGKAVKYSYVIKGGLPEAKSYQWAKAFGLYLQDPLLESNTQYLVDRDLEQKGFIKKTEKADVLIWIDYEYDYNNYQLRTLNLNISRPDDNKLVWRGTAVGVIRTDPFSGELKKAVEGILANLPAK